MSPADYADLQNDARPATTRETRVNAFTPAQSTHYFRICRMYGSPCGALGGQAIRAMKRLYKAAGKNWFGSAPELTVAGPIEREVSVTQVRIPNYRPGFLSARQAS
jgi:hypothetical protein